jgi:hypothetical protein
MQSAKGAFDKNLEILHSIHITYSIGLIIHSLDEHPLVLKCLHGQCLHIAHAKCKGAFDKNLEILHSTHITYSIGLIIRSLDEHPLVIKCLHVAHAKCKGAFDKNLELPALRWDLKTWKSL